MATKNDRRHLALKRWEKDLNQMVSELIRLPAGPLKDAAVQRAEAKRKAIESLKSKL